MMSIKREISAWNSNFSPLIEASSKLFSDGSLSVLTLPRTPECGAKCMYPQRATRNAQMIVRRKCRPRGRDLMIIGNSLSWLEENSKVTINMFIL